MHYPPLMAELRSDKEMEKIMQYGCIALLLVDPVYCNKRPKKVPTKKLVWGKGKL